ARGAVWHSCDGVAICHGAALRALSVLKLLPSARDPLSRRSGRGGQGAKGRGRAEGARDSGSDYRLSSVGVGRVAAAAAGAPPLELPVEGPPVEAQDPRGEGL